MRVAALGDRIGVTYKRVGPSRLPGADRHDIGAGYAGASTALVAAAVFSALVYGLDALGSPVGVGGPVLVIVAACALPFVTGVAPGGSSPKGRRCWAPLRPSWERY